MTQSENQPAVVSVSTKKRLVIVLLVFFIALGVRLLNWQAVGNEPLVVQSGVAENYKQLAHLIRANGFSSLYDSASPTSNPELLGHPPGYPILLALVYNVTGPSDRVVQILQIFLDALSAVLILLIAFEIFSAPVALTGALFAALAPQFTWNCLTLLPDSLAAFPILLAVLLIVRASKRDATNRHAVLSCFFAGALISASCWFRANALLLPLFLLITFPLLRKRNDRLKPALVFVAGALLFIAPLTIRNGIVFRKFIPVSLGAGQTLLEGLADYDHDGSLGLQQTDVELVRAEALAYNRPDYAPSLFKPDGIERDRDRVRRGVRIIASHPVWFAGVMVQRAGSMLRLERTPLRLETNRGSNGWRVFQWPLRWLQKLFLTAIFLPLLLLGVGVLAWQRRFAILALMLIVPGYYFCTQSALHTEYRYVLVIHYFLFLLAAVGLHWLAHKFKTFGVR
jgi:4-amino-4-deoxy-L-arabinose transferase-like glycosyltransferase